MSSPHYKLVVGLGNPGATYLFTRHNVGFMVLDAWADEENERFREESVRHSQVAALPTGERLVKPMTYMNESGKAVASWLEWLKLTVTDLLVVVDDVALPLGQIRLRSEGRQAVTTALSRLKATWAPRVMPGYGAGWMRCLRAGRWNAGCFPALVPQRKKRWCGWSVRPVWRLNVARVKELR